jgi:hypothetical protein
MCTPQIYKQMQSGGKRLPAGSAGARLDKAQRDASSTSGGGTFAGGTILAGTPKNTDIAAIRKTTFMGV